MLILDKKVYPCDYCGEDVATEIISVDGKKLQHIWYFSITGYANKLQTRFWCSFSCLSKYYKSFGTE